MLELKSHYVRTRLNALTEIIAGCTARPYSVGLPAHSKNIVARDARSLFLGA
jgi:hypothetical protein